MAVIAVFSLLNPVEMVKIVVAHRASAKVVARTAGLLYNTWSVLMATAINSGTTVLH